MGKRILIFSQGRTCCNLLEKFLSQQPDTEYCHHPVFKAQPAQKKLFELGRLEAAPAPLQEKFFSACEEGYEAFQKFAADADKAGKTTFVHEHTLWTIRPDLTSDYIFSDTGRPSRSWDVATGTDAHHTNPTVFPDEMFTHPDTTVIITTRHPALLVPSAYKGLLIRDGAEYPDTKDRTVITYRWQVLLLDWLESQGVKTVVVDAADFASDEEQSKKFMTLFCEKTGLDAGSLLYSWPQATEQKLKSLPSHVVAMRKTILTSNGLIPQKVATIKSVVEYQAEFGPEGGAFVKHVIAENMPLYEHLYERRLKVVE